MFERFTERARQVVVFAQDEARALKHNYIGTEHLLLGLLREEEGLAARVLWSFDVAIEEVRAQVARLIGQGDEITTGQIPFTPRAKKVLDLSLRDAMSLGHNYIGTEHLLLGLVREGQGVAMRVLLDFDADAEAIRNEVIRMLAGPGRRPTPRAGPYEPTTPPLAEEVAEAIRQARLEKEESIEAREFERAAHARDRERRLTRAARQLESAWEGRESVEVDVHERAMSFERVEHAARRGARVAFLLVAPVALVAIGLGLLSGWLIWG